MADTLLHKMRRQLPYLLRGLALYFLIEPAFLKFVEHPTIVGHFTRFGFPQPSLVVYAVGVVEVIAVLALALGIGARVMAAVVCLIMVVAMATAGPSLDNGMVLLSCLGIVRLGAGADALWEPTFARP